MNPEIIGIIAGIFTSCAYLPQALKTLRTRNVKGLAPGTHILLNIGLSLWIAYGVMIESWSVILANTLGLLPNMLLLGLILKSRRA